MDACGNFKFITSFDGNLSVVNGVLVISMDVFNRCSAHKALHVPSKSLQLNCPSSMTPQDKLRVMNLKDVLR